MAKLVWGADGTRTFEAGVDRGVLYLPGVAGVAWGGIKSIKENPTGGDPVPYYYDGLKYANVAVSEEYNATLSAMSAPVEFNACDGTARLAAGLFATQQPRQEFGLSYRTRVGNDLKGVDNAYKIHLVYNALAAPSARDNSSTSDMVDPMDLSWNISTRPPTAVNYRPTAHLVIQTADLTTARLAALEKVLYGDANTTPTMPTQAALITLLST